MHIVIKIFHRIHLRFKSFSYLYTLLEKSARIGARDGRPRWREKKKK